MPRSQPFQLPRATLGVGRFGEPLEVVDAWTALGNPGLGRTYIERPPDADPNTPCLVGAADELVASTTTSLLPAPALTWDVNGWYRDLGIPWPQHRATRRELLGAGREAERNVHLAYGLRVLLDRVPEFPRAFYDRMPLGTHHIDPVEQDEIDTRRMSDAKHGSAVLASEGIEKSAEEILAEQGFSQLDDEEYEEHQRSQAQGPLSEVSGSPFPWSFYLLGEVDVDLDVLAMWQEELLTAIRELSPVYRRELEGFAVGMAGGQKWEWDVQIVDDELVFFIHVNPRLHSVAPLALAAVTWAFGRDKYLDATRLHRRGKKNSNG